MRARGVPNPLLSVALVPVALREITRLGVATGNPEAAAEAFDALAELWANADPLLQQRLGELEGEIERAFGRR